MRSAILLGLLALVTAKGSSSTYRGYGSSYSGYRGGYYGRSYTYMYYPYYYPGYHHYYRPPPGYSSNLAQGGAVAETPDLKALLDESFCRRSLGLARYNDTAFTTVSERACFKYLAGSDDRTTATAIDRGLMIPDAYLTTTSYGEGPFKVSFSYWPASPEASIDLPSFTEYNYSQKFVFALDVEFQSISAEVNGYVHTWDLADVDMPQYQRPVQRMIDSARVAEGNMSGMVNSTSTTSSRTSIIGAISLRLRQAGEFAEDEAEAAFMRPSSARVEIHLRLLNSASVVTSVKVKFAVRAPRSILKHRAVGPLDVPPAVAISPESTTAGTFTHTPGILNTQCQPRVMFGAGAKPVGNCDDDPTKTGTVTIENAQAIAAVAALEPPTGYVSMDPFVNMQRNNNAKLSKGTQAEALAGSMRLVSDQVSSTTDSYVVYEANFGASPVRGGAEVGMTIGRFDPMELRLRSPAWSTYVGLFAVILSVVALLL